MLVPLAYLFCFGFPLLQVRSPPSAGTGEGGGSTLHLYEQQRFLHPIYTSEDASNALLPPLLPPFVFPLSPPSARLRAANIKGPYLHTLSLPERAEGYRLKTTALMSKPPPPSRMSSQSPGPRHETREFSLLIFAPISLPPGGLPKNTIPSKTTFLDRNNDSPAPPDASERFLPKRNAHHASGPRHQTREFPLLIFAPISLPPGRAVMENSE